MFNPFKKKEPEIIKLLRSIDSRLSTLESTVRDVGHDTYRKKPSIVTAHWNDGNYM